MDTKWLSPIGPFWFSYKQRSSGHDNIQIKVIYGINALVCIITIAVSILKETEQTSISPMTVATFGYIISASISEFTLDKSTRRYRGLLAITKQNLQKYTLVQLFIPLVFSVFAIIYQIFSVAERSNNQTQWLLLFMIGYFTIRIFLPVSFKISDNKTK